ncbi:hypothetical protein CMUS01_05469 [Colletotrichum musicola]|uniref:Uncharacterized protein n=1 Tax=Colletotrichum musicola TaxID=2175873 RepID=A0A8H6KRF7_9PEZI|nr:hypothetical protein CMUS01_05469 [Colletotrichum musicola]
MDLLPVEILTQICEHLCFHCQNPGVFPHADTAQVCDAKRALARLCRTSKAISAVAHPVLYHYYATGNLSVEELYSNGNYTRSLDRQHDFLTRFLHTIIVGRPELASHVVSMQLVCQYAFVSYTGLQPILDDLVDHEGKTRRWDVSGPTSNVWVFKEVHTWLWKLAIRSCPRLQSLLICCENLAGPSDGIFPRDVRLPMLRTLGLHTGDCPIHFHDIGTLLHLGPNLEVFYLNGETGWLDGAAVSWSGDSPNLPKMRRMLISGPDSPDQVYHLLKSVPSLEYLELYWLPNTWFTITSVLLEPVRKTLKSLRYSCLVRRPLGSRQPFWIQPSVESTDSRRTVAGTLRDFTALEELSIDCRALYRVGDQDEADRLVSLLPSSIRSLRISYLFRGLQTSLRQLAQVAPAKFPRLKHVEIGVAELTAPEHETSIAETESLGARFRTSGIDFVWMTDLFSTNGRTLLPGASVGSSLVPVPGST